MVRRSKMTLAAVLAAALTSAAIAGGAAMAQSPEPVSSDRAEVLAKREAAMKAMGGAMRTIGAYVKNEGGSIEQVREQAAVLERTSKTLAPNLFPAGTGAGAGGSESEALPVIWERWSDFETAAGRLETASAGLVEASAGDDRAAVARQFAAVGQSCGGCHEQFRAKKN